VALGVTGLVHAAIPVDVLVIALVLMDAPKPETGGALSVVIVCENVSVTVSMEVAADERERVFGLGFVAELVVVLALVTELVLVSGGVCVVLIMLVSLSSSGSSKESKELHSGQGSIPATGVLQSGHGLIKGREFTRGVGVPKTLERFSRPRVFFELGWGGGVGGLLRPRRKLGLTLSPSTLLPKAA
jgi:hypothetical protein